MKHITLLLLLTILASGAVRVSGSTRSKEPRSYIYRLTLADKAQTPFRLSHPTRWLSHRAVERRQRQGLSVDSTDLPVSPRYVHALKAQRGIEVVGQSRWMNSVLVRSTDTTVLKGLARLPFVSKAECVWQTPDSTGQTARLVDVRTRLNKWDSVPGQHYGHGFEQIEMLNGRRLHNAGFRGKGMTIAVLDGGFQNATCIPALEGSRIDGCRDIITGSDEVTGPLYTDHGTKVLSALAACQPEVLVGTAPEARFWIIRCEDQESEQQVEEDYWVMAAELADSAGADIISSSLGYNEFDFAWQNHTLAQLDGSSTYISRAASMLAGKGIVLVNSAGNTGMGPWKKLCAPADAHEMLTVGAVNSDGTNAPFSAVGPTQDGRVKPDVTALGAPTALLSSRGTVVHDMGTSFSTPVVSGLVACLWQALPGKSAIDIINLVRKTASNAKTPNNIYGYGQPDFWKAYMVGKL